MNNKPIIFADMDGVLVDFDEQIRIITGIKGDISKRLPRPELSKLSITKDFFINAPELPNAQKLLAFITQIAGSYQILSAPPHLDQPKGIREKKIWIANHLTINPPAKENFEREKYKYAVQADGTPNVLIDDWDYNINLWNQHGGIGILYKDSDFSSLMKDIAAAYKTAQNIKSTPKKTEESVLKTHKKTLTSEQVINYVKHIHKNYKLVKPIQRHSEWILGEVKLSKLSNPEFRELDDPYGRKIRINFEHVNTLDASSLNPIVIDTNGFVLDGNHRVTKAHMEGLDKITALRPKIMTEEKNNKPDPTFALACKRLAPMMQMKMIVTWKHDEINDEDYDVQLVYCVNPQTGKAYCESKVFDSESDLLHNFKHFSAVNLSLADLQDEIRDGNIESINRDNLERVEQSARKMLGLDAQKESVNESVLFEGGNVFKTAEGPLTQRINRADIKPTLQFLEKITGLPLQQNVLGSVGKKASSGDIDVGVDASTITKDELAKRILVWVQKYHPEDAPRLWVAKSGDSVHFRTPIAGKEANGFVQTDLMFSDDMAFQKFSMASEGDKSAYSGMDRNVLLASIAKGRGMKWSYKAGLVNRETGETISKDPNKIAQLLLGKGAHPEQLLSVESIINALKNDPQFSALIADAKDTFAKSGKSLGESKYTEMLRDKVALNELNMAPGWLKKHISQVGAKFTAGFEAECIFKGLGGGGDYDGEPEPDMDYNENLHRNIDFDDIRQFFELSRNDRGLEKMQNDFSDFYWEKGQEWISDNMQEKMEELAADHNNGIEDEDDHMAPEDFEDEAREELETDYNEGGGGPDLYDWLRDELNCNDWEDIGNYFGFSWPHWTSSETSSDGGYNRDGAQHVADLLDQALGMKVQVNDDYHGGRRNDAFIIEPDSSITPDDSDDMGCEIVSPPLPLPQTLDLLHKTLQTINRNSGYTNESTGLHINLSIKDMELDYLKLALFVGDERVLQQFNRLTNIYTAQASQVLSKNLKTGGTLENDVKVINFILNKLAQDFNYTKSRQMAEIFKTQALGKYVSVNFHQSQNYVEFRSMGGEYSYKWPEIHDNVLRFARALEVAADPEAYKKEYAAKLYKMLMSSVSSSNPMYVALQDVIVGFASLQSGQLDKEQLKTLLRKRATARWDQQNLNGVPAPKKPNLPK
jgi:hypothetical protein